MQLNTALILVQIGLSLYLIRRTMNPTLTTAINGISTQLTSLANTTNAVLTKLNERGDATPEQIAQLTAFAGTIESIDQTLKNALNPPSTEN